jgi:hypothetical protein
MVVPILSRTKRTAVFTNQKGDTTVAIRRSPPLLAITDEKRVYITSHKPQKVIFAYSRLPFE